MNYKIYQLTNDGICKYGFMPYMFAKDHGFSLGDYKEVYEGEYLLEKEDLIKILDDMFWIFNMDRPSDFKGHSLSVSDIVELNGTKYYCDSCGWEEIK